MRTYEYETELAWGGDEPTAELQVKVSYTMSWGSPESGNFGPPENYDPGSPNVVENIKLLTVDGKARPWDMGYGYLTDEEFEDMVIEKLEAEHEESMVNQAIEEHH